MSSKQTKYITLLLILIISFFYFSYLLKWEPIILGVIKELILLPSILFQFGLSFYFIFKLSDNLTKSEVYIFYILILYSLILFIWCPVTNRSLNAYSKLSQKALILHLKPVFGLVWIVNVLLTAKLLYLDLPVYITLFGTILS